MITDLSVVEDPILTNPDSGQFGVWSFKYLIEQMSGSNDPSLFALSLFTHGDEQTINGFDVPPRPAVQEKIIDPWLQRGGGTLDLKFAPVKLLAIVNRIDLRQVEGSEVLSAGEGRFVFGVLDAEGKPLAPTGGDAVGGMTIILEYSLPAQSSKDLQRWAEDWHELGKYKPGTPAYNLRLAVLTKRFTDRGRGIGRPNRSALNQIRTNDIALATPWELREWTIDEITGFLKPHSVAETPDFLTFNNTSDLADLLNANATSIRNASFTLPADLMAGSAPAGPYFDLRPDLPFELFEANFAAAQATVDFGVMDGTFLNDLLAFFQSAPVANPIEGTDVVVNIPWQTPTGVDPDVRHLFAVNTCSGCHRDETATEFLHVGFPESARGQNLFSDSMGSQAFLSAFLTGGDPVVDPINPDLQHEFNDLQRRQGDLEELLTSGPRQHHRTNRRH